MGEIAEFAGKTGLSEKFQDVWPLGMLALAGIDSETLTGQPTAKTFPTQSLETDP
ncbi:MULTISPECIES: hypothetical protein [Pirellulaceae]|uniref:hypothetical protein n=1 Tax=Pirellulaceae TaxID=2691357 RepID=UPI001304FA01|nr:MULTISPECIES: hypothetical protein [Pirellulaceae]